MGAKTEINAKQIFGHRSAQNTSSKENGFDSKYGYKLNHPPAPLQEHVLKEAE